ncbi:MAG: phage Gp37/Gp68 family protein [Rhodospirillales bacterium]|nr:phage Gp37/Gp68 family protein [Rhodospirillales bacterium]
MADGTHIEWSDATWNPITGCSVVSPGCTICYAMKLAGRRLKGHPSRRGLTDETKAGPVWNGKVRFNEQWLNQPLRWRKPRRIFVCAHGDLFHPSVPMKWIDKVFAVMALTPHHQFQVLTKRPERMRDYLWRLQDSEDGTIDWANAGVEIVGSEADGFIDAAPWPLPNVWLGTSVEDQQRADERIHFLLDTPAAVRFISAEPLLGPIDLTRLRPPGYTWIDCLEGRYHDGPSVSAGNARLHWVIVGGESGHGSRPMHPQWARDIRDQCVAAGVPLHFKQHGNWVHATDWLNFSRASRRTLLHRDGSRPKPHADLEWSDTDVAKMIVVPKAIAGRSLDGRTWDQFPGATA